MDQNGKISSGRERKMDLLKQKLANYNYTKRFGPDSIELIEELLGNLVQASENLSGLKQRYANKADEKAQTEAEVESVKRENRRLIRENNSMHLQVIREAEDHKDIHRRLELELRRVKDENKEVRFVASQYKHKMRALEKDNENLKIKATKIFQSGTTIKLVGGKEVKTTGEQGQSIDQSIPLKAVQRSEEHGAKSSSKPSDIPENLQNRVHELEQQTSAAERALSDAKEELQILESRISTRDIEIERLGKELARGTNMEAAKLRNQCVNQEGQISDLKQQLDFLYGQLADFEGDLVSRDDMVVRVKNLDKENDALKAKVKSEVSTKEKLCRELMDLKYTVQQLQRLESAKSTVKSGKPKESLQKVKSERDSLRKQLDSLQTIPAREGDVSLKSVELVSLREQVKALEIERDSLRDRMKQTDSDAFRVQKEASSLKSDRDVVREALLRSDENHKKDQTTISNLRAELEGTKAAMQRHIEDGRSLAERCGRLEEENERLNSDLTNEKRVSSTRRTPVSKLKGPTSSIVRSLEEEKAFLKKECEKLQEVARKERGKSIKLEEMKSAIEAQLAKANVELGTIREKYAENLDTMSQKDAEILKLQSQTANLQRELDEMNSLKTKHSMIVNQNQERTAELIHCESELNQLTRKLESALAKIEVLEQDKIALMKVVDDVKKERDTMADMVRNFENHVDDIQNRVVTLGRDRNDVRTRLQQADEDVKKYSELEREARMEIEKLSTQVRRFEQETDSLHREVQFHKNDAEKVRLVVEELREQLAEVRGRRAAAADEEARVHIEVKSAHEERDAVRNQLKTVTEQKDDLRQAVKTLSDERDGARREAKELSLQIEQLKTLLAQLGRAREAEAGKARNQEGQVAQLKRSIEELEGAIMAGMSREEDLKMTIESHKHALDRISSQKDALQEEADGKTEIIVNHQAALEQAEDAACRSEAALEAATQQLELQLSQLNEKEQLIRKMQESIQNADGSLQSVSEELAFKSGALDELTNDLNNMTKENQAVNRELASVISERDAFAQELQEYVQRVLYIEEMVKSKEREKIEILNSFRSLSDDHTRVAKVAENVESEKSQLELSLREQENQSRLLHQRLQETEMQNSRYRADLEALELHTQKLSHSLAQVSGSYEQTKERASQLEGDLAATRNVYATAEQTRQNLTRQVYLEESEKDKMNDELEELQARNSILENSLEAERERGVQLEGLLLEERSRTGRVMQMEKDVSVASQSSLVKLQKEVKRLQEHTQVLENQLNESSTVRGELAGEADALRRQLGKVTSKLRTLKTEMGSHAKIPISSDTVSSQARKIRDYEKEKSQMKDFITRYEKELDKAETRLRDFEAVYREKENQIEKLSRSHLEKEEEIAILKGQIESIKEEFSISDPSPDAARVRVLPGSGFGAESPITGSSLTSSSALDDLDDGSVEEENETTDPALVLVIKDDKEEEEPSVL